MKATQIRLLVLAAFLILLFQHSFATPPGIIPMGFADVGYDAKINSVEDFGLVNQDMQAFLRENALVGRVLVFVVPFPNRYRVVLIYREGEPPLDENVTKKIVLFVHDRLVLARKARAEIH